MNGPSQLLAKPGAHAGEVVVPGSAELGGDKSQKWPIITMESVKRLTILRGCVLMEQIWHNPALKSERIFLHSQWNLLKIQCQGSSECVKSSSAVTVDLTATHIRVRCAHAHAHGKREASSRRVIGAPGLLPTGSRHVRRRDSTANLSTSRRATSAAEPGHVVRST